MPKKNRPWSANDRAQLTALKRRGWSCRAIALRLGRSLGSVYLMLHRAREKSAVHYYVVGLLLRPKFAERLILSSHRRKEPAERAAATFRARLEDYDAIEVERAEGLTAYDAARAAANNQSSPH